MPLPNPLQSMPGGGASPQRRRPASDRYAVRRQRLAALSGRLLAAAVLVTLVLFALTFYGLVAEHAGWF